MWSLLARIGIARKYVPLHINSHSALFLFDSVYYRQHCLDHYYAIPTRSTLVNMRVNRCSCNGFTLFEFHSVARARILGNMELRNDSILLRLQLK